MYLRCPVYPTFWLSRVLADMWTLFPKEEDFFEWFQKAGFQDIKLRKIGPKWYRGARRHGLILGCCVTGVKPLSGDSPLKLGPQVENAKKPGSPFVFLWRFSLGLIGSAYCMLVPVYTWIKDKNFPSVDVGNKCRIF